MKKIAIIGLGYVGLPLAVEFGKKYPVVGFDINVKRVAELNAGHDHTLETEDEDLQSVLSQGGQLGLELTTELEAIRNAQIYIVTVPTPIDKYKRPDLTPLIKASETVGKVISKGDIVIYESTVYPGATEEDCLPVIEKQSGLKFNVDFYAGYSPERINPGDKVNTLTTIKKITSGSTPEIAQEVDDLYNTILLNGTHMATSIKVAEAAKVIENAQRDLNISFVNELALIFDRMDIDTNEVIEAAGTKWNFLKYRPGLVGGHCIGVDPYYLAFKAEALGYNPAVIRSGRRVNDEMAHFVASKVVKLMIKKGLTILNSNVLLLGVTFKENCPDIRNTKTVDIVDELQEFGCQLDIYDPWANQEEVKYEYGIKIMEKDVDIYAKKYDAIILAVSHDQFAKLDMDRLTNGDKSVIFDIKGFLPKDKVDGRL
ncbi:MAG: Vi polysaccharide biosynthesis protein VipA/TviB [Bacteroidetes bacterium]|nr:MAG: Vi polysaccharide biosynthesis protein VipA/TviB [Bacteroidota bacterium]